MLLPSATKDTAADLFSLGFIVWMTDAVLLAARGRGEADALHLAFSIGVVAAFCAIASLVARWIPVRPLLAAAAIALVWFARYGFAPPSTPRIAVALFFTAIVLFAAWRLRAEQLIVVVPLALLAHQAWITRKVPGWGPILAAALLTALVLPIYRWLKARPRAVAAAAGVAVVLAVVAAVPLRRRVGSRTTTSRAAEQLSTSQTNVVLIVIDTLRADRLGAFGYRVRPTSPFLDSLAQRSTVFPRAYSPSSWTMPSVASILTGVPPGRHGIITSDHVIRADVPTLAERLRNAGYATIGLSANFGLDDTHSYARGFARYTILWRIIRGTWDPVPSIWDDVNTVLTHFYDEWADLLPDWNWKPHADDVTSRAIAEVDAAPRDRPLFLYVQYVDPHTPCDAPHRDGWRPSAADHAFDQEWSVEYDREIRRLDEALKRFVEHVDQRLDPARTMLIVVADHGEQLGEDGWRGHGLNLSEATIHVPLIVRFPAGVNPPNEPAAPFGTARVFDLAIAAANLDSNRPASLHPQSSLVRGDELLRSITDGVYKLVQTWDIRSGRMTREVLLRIPDETHDLRATAPAVAEQLRSALSEEPMPVASSQTLSDEAKAKFRALGYIH